MKAASHAQIKITVFLQAPPVLHKLGVGSVVDQMGFALFRSLGCVAKPPTINVWHFRYRVRVDSDLNLLRQRALLDEHAGPANILLASCTVIEKLVALEVGFDVLFVAVVAEYSALSVWIAEGNAHLVVVFAKWLWL